ncbi:hypothetical protein [Streptomyces tubercidicus]
MSHHAEVTITRQGADWVVAEADDDRAFQLIKGVGFLRDERLGPSRYRLPRYGAGDYYEEAASRAARLLAQEGYSVSLDPALTSSSVPRAERRNLGEVRTSALGPGGGSTVCWNDRLAAARPEEFNELFSTSITGDSGTVAGLHQMLETASEWCRAHGARGTAAELDVLAGRLADLGEELHLVREGMAQEIHSGSHRAAAAAHASPAASIRGAHVGPPTETPAPLPPAPVRSLPRSR